MGLGWSLDKQVEKKECHFHSSCNFLGHCERNEQEFLRVFALLLVELEIICLYSVYLVKEIPCPGREYFGNHLEILVDITLEMSFLPGWHSLYC